MARLSSGLAEDLWCGPPPYDIPHPGFRRDVQPLLSGPSPHVDEERIEAGEPYAGVLCNNLGVCGLGHLWSASEELQPGGPRDAYDEMLSG